MPRQVDMTSIVDRHLISHMNAAIKELDNLTDEWLAAGHIPEVDWSKIRLMDFQDALRSRTAIAKRLEGKGCVLCEKFDEHVGYLITPSGPTEPLLSVCPYSSAEEARSRDWQA